MKIIYQDDVPQEPPKVGDVIRLDFSDGTSDSFLIVKSYLQPTDTLSYSLLDLESMCICHTTTDIISLYNKVVGPKQVRVYKDVSLLVK